MPIPDHYKDDSLVAAATDEIIAQTGSKVMQIHRFHSDDSVHVQSLLTFFSPRAGAQILDLACGVGEVARLMYLHRPDLEFTLNNIGEYQLSQCPKYMAQLPGDMHHLDGACDRSFDAVMLCYAVGHSYIDELFAEIYRVLRPGGAFFFYDILSLGGECGLLKLGYTAYSLSQVIVAAQIAGLELNRVSAAPRGIIPEGFFITAPEGCLENTCSYAAVFHKP